MAGHGTYDGTIKTLQDRRMQLRSELIQLGSEIEALDKAIAILTSVVEGAPKSKIDEQNEPAVKAHNPNQIGSNGIYSQISIRWACLSILSKAGSLGLTSAAVTELLVKGGRTSKADRFASTVSAVLSNMKMKGEVEQIGNYWRLSQHGDKALEAIKPRLQQLEDHLSLETSPASL